MLTFTVMPCYVMLSQSCQSYVWWRVPLSMSDSWVCVLLHTAHVLGTHACVVKAGSFNILCLFVFYASHLFWRKKLSDWFPQYHTQYCHPQDQDTGWVMFQGRWYYLPRAWLETLMEVWIVKMEQAQEWTVPFFKCHGCKTVCSSMQAYYALTVVNVYVMLYSFKCIKQCS